MHSIDQSLWQTLRNHPLRSVGAGLTAAFIVASCTDWNLQEQEYPPSDLNSADQAIFFADIDSKGSQSMKALQRDFRKSSMGRDFYNFAVAHNMVMKWVPGRGGEYRSFRGGGLILIGIDNTQDETLLALGHELQHGIQDKIYGRPSFAFNVYTAWAIVRLYEANACATSVDYAANYLKETGVKLNPSGSLYGHKIIQEFLKHPESQKNYKDHIVEPCFKELDGIYNELSLLNLNNVFFQNLQKKERMVADNGVAHKVLLPYFSRAPLSNQPDKSINDMETSQFFLWLHKISKPEDQNIQLLLKRTWMQERAYFPAS